MANSLGAQEAHASSTTVEGPAARDSGPSSYSFYPNRGEDRPSAPSILKPYDHMDDKELDRAMDEWERAEAAAQEPAAAPERLWKGAKVKLERLAYEASRYLKGKAKHFLWGE